MYSYILSLKRHWDLYCNLECMWYHMYPVFPFTVCVLKFETSRMSLKQLHSGAFYWNRVNQPLAMCCILIFSSHLLFSMCKLWNKQDRYSAGFIRAYLKVLKILEIKLIIDCILGLRKITIFIIYIYIYFFFLCM